MNRKNRNRVIAMFMVVLMMIGLLPNQGGMEAQAADGTYVFDAATESAITGAEKKAAIPAGNYGTNQYFSLAGTVTRGNSSTYSAELGKAETGTLSFTVTGTADVVVTTTSTGSSNSSDLSLENESGEKITAVGEATGIKVITGSSAIETSYVGLKAGTYSIVSPSDGENTGRGIRVLSVTVTESAAVVDELAAMEIATPAETYHFKNNSQVFGQDTVTDDVVYSANKYIKLSKGDNESLTTLTNSHGVWFTSPIVFETIVPAQTMGELTVIGCQYGSCSAVLKAGDYTGESASLKTATENDEVKFTYTNESNATVRMQLVVTPSGTGYIHGISYDVQEMPAKAWQSGKTGTVTIGDTTFTVAAGANDSANYTVAATTGTGSVVAGNNVKTVVWANLGGKNLANAVTAGEGVSEVSVKNNQVTLTYSDTATMPESYVLEVRDLGKAEEPVLDGKKHSYTLTDGSVFSELLTDKLANGTVIKSEDGLVSFVSAGSMKYNDGTHGVAVGPNDTITVKVAGNATVSITGSSFGTSGITASAGKGTVYLADDATKTQVSADTSSLNPTTTTFTYEGEATVLTFTFTGGTSYVRGLTATNELPKAPVADTHPETATQTPSLLNWDAGQLQAILAGQTWTLKNDDVTSIPKTNIKTSGMGIFVFPLTEDNNTLSVDLLIDDANGAVFVGLFNESVVGDANGIRAITTGVRGSTNEAVQLMSKKDTEVFGKNSFSGAAMAVGDVVRITITRDGEKVIQTFTNLTQGTDTVTKSTKYSDCKSFLNPDGTVYYGLSVYNKTAKVTNMVYTAADGTVIFDQNKYYDPVGDVPVVESVTAEAAADRTKIDISWVAAPALYDAKYVLQVLKPGTTEWVDVATELTVTSYEYPVGINDSGEYQFRVCGTKGNAEAQNLANRNTWKTSAKAEIDAALETPELTVDYVSANGKVELSWTASAGAENYEIYRHESGKKAELLKTVSAAELSYTDSAVTDETVYYYSVCAISSDNFSPKCEEEWTLVSKGHTGDFDENIALHITKRSYNTVFTNKISLEGIVGASGTVKLYVNGTEKGSQAVAAAGGSFTFNNVEIAAGRNEVELILEYGTNLKLRKSLNFVYLTDYEYVVDDSFTGADGTADENGIPQYKTVKAAIAAAAAASGDKKILIRNGQYNEKLVIEAANISLIGEDSEATRIYYAVCDGTKADEADGTRYAVSVMKTATGFTAENLTFENAYAYCGAYSNESAEAVYCEANNALFVGVRMLSYQDTLQHKNGSSNFVRCYILGNVDFLWGQKTKALFDDCDIVFRYSDVKNSGYYTAYGPESDVVFNNCRFTAESECGGSKYYLGRPYNNATQITFIDCYMGSTINKEWGYSTWGQKELSSDPASYEAALYYECGSYGAGYAVNINRRQISKSEAAAKVAAAGITAVLGYDPYQAVEALGGKYVGSIVTAANTGSVTSEYKADKYSPYEGDDTNLGQFGLEGFAQSAGTTGGGLLKEDNANYYKVATGDEFLAALKAIKDKKGVPSVIEITSDSIALGINEISKDYESLYGTGIVQAHNAALVNPVLKESGVSKVYIKEISNLTIFSKNGATIKHGAFSISNSHNIMIRNVDFDELWEWDEGDANNKAGAYDINDWDYMTIENGSSRIWIDHCTFYKAYDGIIDIKTSDAYANNPMYITISWCRFEGGSENDKFFDAMMDYLYENKEDMPYYKSLLDSGMTKDQIRDYAYGQKKTHLLGQNDETPANKNLHVTFANNYYHNSMDRTPRLRFGTAHVYNCIMDSQELLDIMKGIANAEIAKGIVSNGAASTCDGQLLLQNCFINGIRNALNSGNGSSPSGFIAATETLYYVDGIRYAAVPKVNTTKEGEELKITDADAFVAALPYADYALYDAADLKDVVMPYAGAGKLELTTAQWEKASYNDAAYKAPETDTDYDKDNTGLPEYQIPTLPTDGDAKDAVIKVEMSADVEFEDGVDAKDVRLVIKKAADAVAATVKEALEKALAKMKVAIDKADAHYYDISLMAGDKIVKLENGKIAITFDWAEGKSFDKNDVLVYHYADGKLEQVKATVTAGGIRIETDSFSPYVVAYFEKGVLPTMGDNTPIGLYMGIMLMGLVAVAGATVLAKKKYVR